MDHDVWCSKLLVQGFEQACHLCLVLRVAAKGCRARLLAQGFQLVWIARGEGYGQPLAREEPSERCTESAPGSDDQCCLVKRVGQNPARVIGRLSTLLERILYGNFLSPGGADNRSPRRSDDGLSPIALPKSARRGDPLARQPSRIVGSQKHGHLRDVVRLSQTSQRGSRDHLFFEVAADDPDSM